MEGTRGVHEAVSLLQNGDVVAIPTETVYGLAAKALDPTACAKIFEAKERPLSDPLIIHIPDFEWLGQLAKPSPLAKRLAETFWPGPLTIVVERQACVPDLVTAGQETVAIRMSAHPLFEEVLKSLGQPVAAPSANRFGRISPTSATHVLDELGGRIPLILDGGPCVHGIESTIVMVIGETLEILRHGPVTKEQLTEFANISEERSNILSPGSLKSHYAPQTPLKVHPRAILETWTRSDQKVGLLSWQQPISGFYAMEILTPTGDPVEAASKLYGAMRGLDAAGLDLIVAEEPPTVGLGAAISDRLKKAAAH